VKQYLQSSEHIDFEHPLVRAKAAELAEGRSAAAEVISACFEFVRDHIEHSNDYQRDVVTCAASDALIHGTGLCYAKSHLLAALLRANGIPAGLCYQRLSAGDGGAPYCLHGLNAVHTEAFGWIRLDARGNKPGVNARFQPPGEYLAFPINEPEEADFPEIWPEPLDVVAAALSRWRTLAEIMENLPDIAVTSALTGDFGGKLSPSGEGRNLKPSSKSRS
jgi:transglutaminase-like putative cysteine protease